MFQAILFDLDGTLIDSAASILAAVAYALAHEGLSPVVPLDPSRIGPPLRDMLQCLSGATDPELLDMLTAAFKSHYDEAGCLEARAFPGVETMLATLAGAGQPMHIATNKRARPTRRILTHLGWTARFDRVYCLDDFSPPLPNKTRLIANLLADAGLDAAQCVYIGDRKEDELAARANRLTFYWACWGFDSAPTPKAAGAGILLHHPDPHILLGAS